MSIFNSEIEIFETLSEIKDKPKECLEMIARFRDATNRAQSLLDDLEECTIKNIDGVAYYSK
tara:strand:+ start:533 stop:718 length:186 start_codon:yes stop_codon:yes gene_type:complete